MPGSARADALRVAAAVLDSGKIPEHHLRLGRRPRPRLRPRGAARAPSRPPASSPRPRTWRRSRPPCRPSCRSGGRASAPMRRARRRRPRPGAATPCSWKAARRKSSASTTPWPTAAMSGSGRSGARCERRQRLRRQLHAWTCRHPDRRRARALAVPSCTPSRRSIRQTVAPGHMLPGTALDGSALAYTRGYLQRFEAELPKARQRPPS